MKTFTTILFVLLVSAVALSQIPRTLSYQGILTDSSGAVKPDGSYSFTFKLYDASTAIWEETKTLQVKNGLFSTALGDATPFGVEVKFDKQYLLGTKVGSEPELTPRIPLTSVAYSLNASLADTTWLRNGSDLYFIYGNVGIGTATPTSTLQVYGGNSGSEIQVVRANMPGSFSHWKYNSGTVEFGTEDADNLQFQTSNTNRMHIDAATGNIGIGTTNPTNKLTIAGPGSGTDESILKVWNGNMRLQNINPRFYISDYLGTGYIGTDNNQNFVIAPGGTERVTITSGGTLKTQVLEITGGSDLAEPFEITNAEMLEPGSVVVIDEENPGKLKLSSEPYDKRVAGVVSGAGGIQPGLTLKQEGVMEGNQNIALSGRVYVKATTENGAITPGDLLTTSSLSGYVMKATDKEKLDGTIIGKAMSALNEGTGLVLVLVNLQ